MTNSEISEKFGIIKTQLDEIIKGLELNLEDNQWYSSQEFHEQSLKKLHAMKIIAGL